MCRAGKRKAVADDVRTILFNRSDVCGIDFGAATAVYQPKPRYRTPLSVRPQHRPAEDPVSQDARGQVTGALSDLLEHEGSLFFMQAGQWNDFANSRQYGCLFPQA